MLVTDVIGRRARCAARFVPLHDCATSDDILEHALKTDAYRLKFASMKVYVNGTILHDCLQDLADEIIFDMVDACASLDEPDLFYPSVEGIEPVSDDHVRALMLGMQRELDRELRGPGGARNSRDARPAVPLSGLPWHVQRGLAERRRLRFLQWGITRAHWERNNWALDDVPLDPEWTPRRKL